MIAWIMSPIPKKLFRSAQNKFFILFTLSIILSTLAVNWITYSFETTIEALKIALIYFFIITIVDTEKRFKILTWTIVFLMAVVGLIVIFQYRGYDITGIGMAWSEAKQTWQVRGVGLFDNPNDIAYSVLLVLPFALGLSIFSTGLISRFAGIGLVVVCCYSVYLTKSRGGYLASIFCIATWLYFLISNKRLKNIALILGFVTILAAFSIQAGNYRDDRSSMGRIEAWADGMRMLGTSPIIGVGKGQFIEHHPRDSHNSFVRAGAELGFLGLYSFIGLLYVTSRSIARKDSGTSSIKWKLYHLSLISYLGAFMVASVFSTRTYDILFLLVVALSEVLDRFSRDITTQDAETFQVGFFSSENLLNKSVFGLTMMCIMVWKLFLVQVW
ncbi:MAG: O-antigen ligase family protein [Anaerolineaceae bacterium]